MFNIDERVAFPQSVLTYLYVVRAGGLHKTLGVLLTLAPAL